MAYTHTEFYMQTANGDPLNGGSDTSAARVYASTASSGDGLTLTATGIGSGNNVGDWLVFDTAGATPYWRRITTKPTNDTVTVDRAVSLSQSGKNCRVGGPWLTPSPNANYGPAKYLADCGATNWPSARSANPPRVNVKAADSYTDTVAIATLGAWTAKIPLTIEAYSASIGDLNHYTGTTRATWRNDTNDNFTSFGNYVRSLSMKFASNAGAGKFIVKQASGNLTGCTFVNCGFSRTGVSINAIQIGANSDPIFIRCYFEKTAAGANSIIYCNAAAAASMTARGCEFVGSGNSASNGACVEAAGTSCGVKLRRCIFRNSEFGVQLSQGSNSTFANTEIEDCDFYALQVGIHCTTTIAAETLYADGNAFENCVKGFDSPTSSPLNKFMWQDFNSFKTDVGTPVDTTYTVDLSANNQTSLAAIFNNASSQDFSIASSSAAKGKGFGGILYAGGAGYTGYADPGALQSSGISGGAAVADDTTAPHPVYGARHIITFPLVNTSGVVQSGATVTAVTISKNLGTYSAASGTVTEIGSSGTYKLALTETEMQGSIVQVLVKATSCVDTFVTIRPRVLAKLLTGHNAVAGAPTYIDLDSTASTQDDYYKGQIVTCRGQARVIGSYVGGATKRAYVTANWKSGDEPTSSDAFEVLLTDAANPSSGNVTAWGGAALPDLPTVSGGKVGVYLMADDIIKASTFHSGDVASVSDLAAAVLLALQNVVPHGTISTGSTTTVVNVAGLASTANDHWKGSILLIREPSVSLTDQQRKISASSYSGGVTSLTVETAFTSAPVNGHAYSIVNGRP